MSRPSNRQQEIRELLLGFATSYLDNRPSNIIDFGVEYSTKLQQSRRQQSQLTTTIEETTPSIILPPDNDSNKNEEEEEENEKIIKQSRYAGRRKSVYAERYNPENDKDEDDDSVTPIAPKSTEEIKRLLKTLKNILFFRFLEPEQMDQVINAIVTRQVAKDEIIMRQNESGDNFYVIDSGIYEAYINDNLIQTYNNTGSFGELALLYNTCRAATIKAVTDGILWTMNRQTFRRIVVRSAFLKRNMHKSLLDKVPLLNELNEYEKMQLSDAIISKIYNAGEIIFHEGDIADGMYLIESGAVSISKKQENYDGSIEISQLGDEEYFGERAMITNLPRAATVCAMEKTKLAFINVETFERLLGPCMEIMKRNIAEYETEMGRTFERLKMNSL